MKAIIAIDSLKRNLSSMQAGDAIREGIQSGIVNGQEAMDSLNARRNMADTVEQVFRLIKVQLT